MVSRRNLGNLNILFLIAGAAIIALLITWAGPEKVYQSFISANPLFLMAALVPLAAAIALRIVKTSLYFRKLGMHYGIRGPVKFTLSVLFLGSISPFRSGELLTGLAVDKGSRKKSTSVVVMDRFIETLATLVLILAATLLARSAFVDNYRILLLIGASFLIFFFVLVVGERMWGFRQHMRLFNPMQLGLMFLLALSATFIESFYFILIFNAFSIELSLASAVFLQQTANIIAFVASTPGGLGSREAYLIAVLTEMGFMAPVVLTAELAYKIVQWLVIIPLGSISFLSLKSESSNASQKRKS